MFRGSRRIDRKWRAKRSNRYERTERVFGHGDKHTWGAEASRSKTGRTWEASLGLDAKHITYTCMISYVSFSCLVNEVAPYYCHVQHNVLRAPLFFSSPLFCLYFFSPENWISLHLVSFFFSFLVEHFAPLDRFVRASVSRNLSFSSSFRGISRHFEMSMKRVTTAIVLTNVLKCIKVVQLSIHEEDIVRF